MPKITSNLNLSLIHMQKVICIQWNLLDIIVWMFPNSVIQVLKSKTLICSKISRAGDCYKSWSVCLGMLKLGSTWNDVGGNSHIHSNGRDERGEWSPWEKGFSLCIAVVSCGKSSVFLTGSRTVLTCLYIKNTEATSRMVLAPGQGGGTQGR